MQKTEEEGTHEMVFIADHWFEVECEDGFVHLVPAVRGSPIGSVVGTGEDLERAKRDVRINAVVLLEELGPEKLPDEFIDFALDVYMDTENENGECMCSACRADRGEISAEEQD